MPDNEDDKHIKKMAQLLRQGATMLDLTCPKCENLLFKLKDGKIFCPSCNQQVIRQSNTNNSSVQIDNNRNLVKSDNSHGNGKLQSILIKKMTEYTSLLENCTQHAEIKKILEILHLMVSLRDKI